MKVKNGKALRIKNLHLVPVDSLSTSEKDDLARVFLNDFSFPVRNQCWLKTDVLFFFERVKFLWSICLNDQGNSIGYLYISETDDCFEIAILEPYLSKGYGVFATLFSINRYFEIKPECSVIKTKISILNSPSLNQAIRFGWKLSETSNGWNILYLKKEDFFKKKNTILNKPVEKEDILDTIFSLSTSSS